MLITDYQTYPESFRSSIHKVIGNPASLPNPNVLAWGTGYCTQRVQHTICNRFCPSN